MKKLCRLKDYHYPFKNMLQCIFFNLGLNGRDECGLTSTIPSRSHLILNSKDKMFDPLAN